jgi:hypothetical protein
MSARLKYHRLTSTRAQMAGVRKSYTSLPSKKPPIMIKPAKDTKTSSLLTYIRSQKSARAKRVKVTLPKLPVED